MSDLLVQASQFLYREAACVDERRWEDWLAMFSPDCEYWVPSWRNEDELTDNPKREMCLVYYASRSGLEDRVWRARSGKSVASAVLPRTSHAIHNVMVSPGTADTIEVASSWTVHQFLPKEKVVEVFFGRYQHTLKTAEGDWKIARKKVILLNDYLPAKIDFYSL